MSQSTARKIKFAEDSQRISPESEEELDEELDRQFNKFDLLDADDDPESNEADDHKSDSQDSDNELEKNQKEVVTASSKQKKKKRRGKGKQNKTNQTVEHQDEEANAIASQLTTTNADQKQSRDKNSISNLLRVNPKNLIPENELKRMFGKCVLKEEKSKEAKSRHHLGLVGPRSQFVSSAINDPRIILPSSGPKMVLDSYFNETATCGSKSTETAKSTGDGSTKTKKSQSSGVKAISDDKPVYFRFVHDESYRTAHLLFLEAAHVGHSDAVIQNLNAHPTHVESIIQLSDMIRISEDFKAASEFIERALLVFERGFHQRFSLTRANCRLSYRRPENRTFFIAVFKHITYCNRRGLRRTPLEYTKLLLSLDPENDPLFATLLIDYFSLRSEDYDYLIDFIDNWKHLSKLPNMKFSFALAHFLRSKSSKQAKASSETSLKIADQSLQEALVLYPNFIIPLLDACGAEPSSELKKCDFFDYSVYSNKYKLVPESVDLLINLYVQRNSIVWKTKSVLTWLERNVASIVEKFLKKELTDEGKHLECWSCYRGLSPRNLLRHIVLSDTSVKVPPSATSSSVLDIDPFPPLEPLVN